MRAFMKRLFICFWVLWAAIFSFALLSTTWDGVTEHSQTFKHDSYSSALVPSVRAVNAYTSGQMPAGDKAIFERALRDRDLNLPIGIEISVQKPFRERFRRVWEALGVGGGFLIAILMLQYLLIGILDPRALLSAPRS